MTTATREELERWAHEADDEAATWQDQIDRGLASEYRLEVVRKYRTIAHALRRLAEAEGQEAKPVAWRGRHVAHRGSGRSWVLHETRPEDHPQYDTEPLYAFPPPAPGYAEGRRDGLEEAAVIAETTYGDGVRIAARIRALTEGSAS